MYVYLHTYIHKYISQFFGSIRPFNKFSTLSYVHVRSMVFTVEVYCYSNMNQWLAPAIESVKPVFNGKELN